jgi:Tol biopolymer transport system component
VEVSPEGGRVACHVTGGKFRDKYGPLPHPSYSICVIELSSGAKTVVSGDPEHLYFGPTWSRDARELAYIDCRYRKDPAHFWADLCVADVAARAHRVVTEGQSHWYGTSYGPADARGGGSNVTRWVGAQLSYTRKMPGSHPDCEHHPERPDHQENVYSPQSARGGTQICLIDPRSRAVHELTKPEQGRWDFRPCWSPDGARFVFARARVGQPAELWVADADGGNARLLTRGHDGRGADHARWISAAV